MLLNEQEKRDQEEQNKASSEEKQSLEENHKKKARTMVEYYSNLQDYSTEIEETERIKRKKSRAVAAAVAISAASNGLANYPEEEFKEAFRMSKATFDMICDELHSFIAKEDTTLRNAIPVKQRVAVCIWRLATGEPLRLLSRRFGLGISTCHKLVLEVCSAIRNVLMPKYLQWPDEDSLKKIKNDFESISGIPNVVGSMYTTHIPIIAPKISVAAYFNKRHTERNQKTSYSITVQGVVDPKGVFTDVCIGWPGSMPDDQVLEKSALYQRANGAAFDVDSACFNEKIGEIQKVAKDAFARLKGRWSCLQKRTEVKLQDLPVVLGACCVLHNICEMREEELDPKLNIELVDDETVPEVAIRSVNSMKARDAIAHNLLHHCHAGTGFL
ncbi:hypothetical protein GH714_029928 [Hevea brasiliensis]|uniref:DDE Tnp4 domain-containing protein n=1 Tax=Hevea brasiliensis TaxID=3981 RepID=A0A6A6LTH4_HEVBR|nr:hypothetical protein GH714_029928 [Hevea brasiliensis]